MQKAALCGRTAYWSHPFITKTILAMKLTALLLTVAIVHVSAKTISQTVTFSGNKATIQQVFNTVESQTGFVFIISKKLSNEAKPITVNANNLPLEDFLKLIFKDQPFNYSIKNKTIVISGKGADKPRPSSILQESDAPPITGVVRGPNAQPVSGANIVIKNTKRGTTANADGSFSLEANVGEVLIISSIGFADREVTIGGSNVGIISLDLSESKLDEVQIIAYGQTSRRLNVGNQSSVKAEEIKNQPVINPLLALQGRVPGVLITQATGLPGSGVTIRIQGQNSILSGNDPLYVIDGVPYISQMLPTINDILGQSGNTSVKTPVGAGNPLSFINPSDIASIDILKDATATAIYGSRAANGAVLITTKRGQPGKTKFDLSYKQGTGKVTRKVRLLNTNEYIEMRKEALENDGIAEPGPFDFDINGTWDKNKYTDWQDKLIGNTAQYRDVQMSISGGSTSTQFNIGANYHRETTVYPTEFGDSRGSLQFSFNNISADQRFRLQLSGSFMNDVNRLMSSDFTLQALSMSPNTPDLRDSAGNINWAPDAFGNTTFFSNPIASLISKYKISTKNLLGNLLLSYKLARGLDIKIGSGYSNLRSDEISINPLTSIIPEDLPFVTRSSIFSNGNVSSWIIEPQATYENSIADGKLQMLIGGTLQSKISEQQRFRASGFNTDLLLEDIKSASKVDVQSTLSLPYKYGALFGRLNYSLRQKYVLEASVRRDGSSRFGSANRFHNFASIGGAWIFSAEHFAQKLNNILSFGKLKGSYGTTGNDQIGDYQYLDLYNSVNPGVPYLGLIGYTPRGIPNPFLQWEETKKLQAGLELGFLKNRLLLSTNYFNNRSSNQLLPYALPTISGLSSLTVNFPATVRNSGWEFSISSINAKKKNFSWETSFNLTILQNKLVSFPGLETSSYAASLTLGQPLSVQKRYKFAGVDPSTGAYQFYDVEGHKTFEPTPGKDDYVFIYTDPKYYGGLTNTISYHNFSLEFVFQYIKKLGLSNRFGNYPGSNANQPINILNRWQKPGDDVPVQRFNYDFSLASNYEKATSSDAAYTDASYLRLRTLSLSYRLSPDWLGRTGVENASFFVNCQNLLTITNFNGLDPENGGLALPPLRVIVFGVSISL